MCLFELTHGSNQLKISPLHLKLYSILDYFKILKENRFSWEHKAAELPCLLSWSFFLDWKIPCWRHIFFGVEEFWRIRVRGSIRAGHVYGKWKDLRSFVVIACLTSRTSRPRVPRCPALHGGGNIVQWKERNEERWNMTDGKKKERKNEELQKERKKEWRIKEWKNKQKKEVD